VTFAFSLVVMCVLRAALKGSSTQHIEHFTVLPARPSTLPAHQHISPEQEKHMTATDWPTVTAHALDMGRAAAQLLDELGPERALELARHVGYRLVTGFRPESARDVYVMVRDECIRCDREVLKPVTEEGPWFCSTCDPF
jgi:hypothetical protein